MSEPPPVPRRNSKYTRKHDEIRQLPYYWPDLKSQEEVSRTVSVHENYSGKFLLRNSFSKAGALTVSVVHYNTVKHFKIEEDCIHDKISYFLDPNKTFHHIRDLIGYYKSHPVPNIDHITDVFLLHPIRRRTPVPSGDTEMITPCNSIQNWIDHNRQYLSSTNSLGPLQSQPSVQTTQKKVYTSESATTQDSSISHSLNLTANPSVMLSQRSDEMEIKQAAERNFIQGRLPRRPSVDERPALPVPNFEGDYGGVYYSHVQAEHDRTQEVIAVLIQNQEADDGRCGCGLLLSKSEVVEGWSVHVQHVEGPVRKLFFQSSHEPPRTDWSLPVEVLRLMTEDKWKILFDLARQLDSSTDMDALIKMKMQSHKTKDRNEQT